MFVNFERFHMQQFQDKLVARAFRLESGGKSRENKVVGRVGLFPICISHDTPCLTPPKFCAPFNFSFLVGIFSLVLVLKEAENNASAKFWGANKVYFGRCASGELLKA